MTEQNGNTKPSKEEVMAAIQECAAKLGRVPSYKEMIETTRIGRFTIKRYFSNYTKALRACGLEPSGTGYKASLDKLFADYAGIVRALGECPTAAEYDLRSRFTRRPMMLRFGVWGNVPTAMLEYAKQESLEAQWGDVLEMLRKHCQEKKAKNGPSSNTLWSTSSSTSMPKILEDRPVYGESLLRLPMAHAPVNEMGVVFLFGAMATRLGFTLLWIGTEFPDGEALREVAPGKWQRVRIEFEFQSRNFVRHMHNPAGCDLIVCWEHNWKDCPLEVVELREALSNQHSAVSKTQNPTAEPRG